MLAENLPELLKSVPERSKPAFGHKRKGKWETVSFQDYFDQAEALGNALFNLGIAKGQKVASVTLNRPEWNVLDLALLNIGAIHVSIFPNFNIQDLTYSVEFTDSEMVFVSSKLLSKQLKEAGLDLPILTFDKFKDGPDNMVDLIAKGKELPSANVTVRSSDIASIYLTSGTSGRSKGVVVSHGAIVNTVEAMKSLYDIGLDDCALSFAPLCVSSERSLNYYYQSHGICTYYTESMQKIVDNMQEVEPTIFLGAPALLEKIREKVFEKSRETSGFGGRILSWSLRVASEFKLNDRSFLYNLQRFIADKLVFKKLRGIMGGRVRFIMAGGAAIPVEVMRFFWALKIPVYEGYGLSECHIVSVNTSNAGIKFGTVGPLFGETQVKLSSQGEILCKNPYLFIEYYKDPVTTASSFDEDGYFKTGDKGEQDGKFLKIVGRVKEIFKIGTGRYISPEAMEKQLNNSQLIQQSIVIGANRPYICSLIVPAFEMLRANRPEWMDKTDEELASDKDVIRLIQTELDSQNMAYIESERVKRFRLMSKPFSIEKGELTPSSKLKRLVIEELYANLISEMYGN